MFRRLDFRFCEQRTKTFLLGKAGSQLNQNAAKKCIGSAKPPQPIIEASVRESCRPESFRAGSTSAEVAAGASVEKIIMINQKENRGANPGNSAFSAENFFYRDAFDNLPVKLVAQSMAIILQQMLLKPTVQKRQLIEMIFF